VAASQVAFSSDSQLLAGLEKMFRTTGQVLTEDILVVPKPTPEELERLLAVVKEYGLEIHAGH
jgi:hypothetical protein